ncbi:MAG TPA: hypothetical protein VK522_10260, partial [Pseudolabrys sp.]|nr:hypothetical protein [Pseudolabrys sp.]
FQLLTAMPSISALTRIDAKIKYDDARRRLSRAKWHRLMANQKADRRARRTGKFNRREVTDGYIRTGKTMMIDGERVPIVRKVRVPK